MFIFAILRSCMKYGYRKLCCIYELCKTAVMLLCNPSCLPQVFSVKLKLLGLKVMINICE